MSKKSSGEFMADLQNQGFTVVRKSYIDKLKSDNDRLTSEVQGTSKPTYRQHQQERDAKMTEALIAGKIFGLDFGPGTDNPL